MGHGVMGTTDMEFTLACTFKCPACHGCGTDDGYTKFESVDEWENRSDVTRFGKPVVS